MQRTIRRRAGGIALIATILLLTATPAWAHEVRYGTNNGLGGNVFYNVASGGQTYCVKGSGWLNHPGTGIYRARSSTTTWFRKGATPSVCAGSSSTSAGAVDNCFGMVSTAIFLNGTLQASATTNSTGAARSSLTASIGGAGTGPGSYTMVGNHYWNSSWPGSCVGPPDVGGSWNVSHAR